MINQDLVNKIHCLLDKGVTPGLSKNPKPGEMCLEQAVCYALGEEVTNKPSCVGEHVRWFVVTLNNCNWSSPSARAEGMRDLAIVQLGSNFLDQNDFTENLRFAVIKKLLPSMFRDLGEEKWEKQIKSLEGAKDLEEARQAASAAAKVAYNSSNDRSPTGIAARHADNAARDASVIKKFYVEDVAYLMAAGVATSAAYGTKTGDKYLKMVAHLAVEVLREMGSPGCQF